MTSLVIVVQSAEVARCLVFQKIAEHREHVDFFWAAFLFYHQPPPTSSSSSSFMRAAKESGKNLIHVIKVSKSDSRSVLKFSARNTSCGDCAECRSKSFETLPDLKRHFEGRHHCVVTIKSLTSEPKATAAVQSSERGQFWNSSPFPGWSRLSFSCFFQIFRVWALLFVFRPFIWLSQLTGLNWFVTAGTKNSPISHCPI